MQQKRESHVEFALPTELLHLGHARFSDALSLSLSTPLSICTLLRLLLMYRQRVTSIIDLLFSITLFLSQLSDLLHVLIPLSHEVRLLLP